MTEAKYHHYVPRFYLSRFTDLNNKLWVFDKSNNKTFTSIPENIGGQNQFYRIDKLIEDRIDPLELEKQFAGLEYEVSNITNDWIRQFSYSKKLIIPDINRELISLFITTQLLRTVEAREQLMQFSSLAVKNFDLSTEPIDLQAALLWDDALIKSMQQRIISCIWIFAENDSQTPFLTSDHPVLVKSFDSKQWILGPRIFDEGMYIVFPISPKLILYCKDPDKWEKIKIFENSISPVKLTDDMVKHENSGQIGMSYRFIFSSEGDFTFTQEFLSENKDFKNPNRSRF